MKTKEETNKAKQIWSQKRKRERLKAQIKDICEEIRVILKNVENTPEIKLNKLYDYINSLENKD